MTIINLLLLQLIIVFIIDISGAVSSFKGLLSRWLTKGTINSKNYALKPLDCSLCMTWWVGLIALLLTHSFTLPMVAVVGGLAMLTPVSADALRTIKDILTWIINQINKITLIK